EPGPRCGNQFRARGDRLPGERSRYARGPGTAPRPAPPGSRPRAADGKGALGARRPGADDRRLVVGELTARELRIAPLRGLPEVREGDELGRLIAESAAPSSDDIVVVSQKVVSKAEGRLRRLDQVEPGERARELAERLEKDPAIVELVLAESTRVVRAERGVLITETRGGWVCANSGIDSSNLEEGWVALLPADADASARAMRAQIGAATGASPAVVIADSFGRAWRVGQTDVAIGCAGIDPVADWRGRRDRGGRKLSATVIAIADELAAAADLVRDKDAGVPGAVISGLGDLVTDDDGPGAAPLRRAAEEALFR